MAVRLRFDFWQFQASKGDTSELLAEVLTTCSQLPREHDDRLLQRDTKVIRLQELTQKGSLWFGDFVGIGVKRPAKKANTKGHLENLAFLEDEGLGEESAFLIDPATNVCILQSNRLAATSNSVVSFFERFTIGRGRLELLPVLSQSGMDQLTQMRNVNSFEVGIAVMDFGPGFGARKPAVSSMLNIASDFEAPKLTLKVSVGHKWRKQGIDIEKIMNFAQDLFGGAERGDLEVQTAQVRGQDEENRLSVLDLISERLNDVVLVEPDDGRAVARQTRWQRLYDAYSKHEDFLERQFGRKK